jgi:hypothetical protein
MREGIDCAVTRNFFKKKKYCFQTIANILSLQDAVEDLAEAPGLH